MDPGRTGKQWGPVTSLRSYCSEASILPPTLPHHQLPKESLGPPSSSIPLHLLPQEGFEGLEAGLPELIVIQVAELLHQRHQAVQVGPCKARRVTEDRPDALPGSPSPQHSVCPCSCIPGHCKLNSEASESNGCGFWL